MNLNNQNTNDAHRLDARGEVERQYAKARRLAELFKRKVQSEGGGRGATTARSKNDLIRAATTIQFGWRESRSQRQLRKRSNSATIIQSVVRGHLSRNKTKIFLDHKIHKQKRKRREKNFEKNIASLEAEFRLLSRISTTDLRTLESLRHGACARRIQLWWKRIQGTHSKEQITADRQIAFTGRQIISIEGLSHQIVAESKGERYNTIHELKKFLEKFKCDLNLDFATHSASSCREDDNVEQIHDEIKLLSKNIERIERNLHSRAVSDRSPHIRESLKRLDQYILDIERCSKFMLSYKSSTKYFDAYKQEHRKYERATLNYSFQNEQRKWWQVNDLDDFFSKPDDLRSLKNKRSYSKEDYTDSFDAFQNEFGDNEASLMWYKFARARNGHEDDETERSLKRLVLLDSSYFRDLTADKVREKMENIDRVTQKYVGHVLLRSLAQSSLMSEASYECKNESALAIQCWFRRLTASKRVSQLKAEHRIRKALEVLIGELSDPRISNICSADLISRAIAKQKEIRSNVTKHY